MYSMYDLTGFQRDLLYDEWCADDDAMRLLWQLLGQLDADEVLVRIPEWLAGRRRATETAHHRQRSPVIEPQTMPLSTSRSTSSTREGKNHEQESEVPLWVGIVDEIDREGLIERVNGHDVSTHRYYGTRRPADRGPRRDDRGGVSGLSRRSLTRSGVALSGGRSVSTSPLGSQWLCRRPTIELAASFRGVTNRSVSSRHVLCDIRPLTIRA